MSEQVAICIPCWWQRWWFAPEPQGYLFPQRWEQCVFCERKTNDGIYIDARFAATPPGAREAAS